MINGENPIIQYLGLRWARQRISPPSSLDFLRISIGTFSSADKHSWRNTVKPRFWAHSTGRGNPQKKTIICVFRSKKTQRVFVKFFRLDKANSKKKNKLKLILIKIEFEIFTDSDPRKLAIPRRSPKFKSPKRPVLFTIQS